MLKMCKFTSVLLIFAAMTMAQRGAGSQLKELEKEKQIEKDTEQASDRQKRNVAAVTPSQKELDDFLFSYIEEIDSTANDKAISDSILKLIEDEARKAAQNSYFSKCSFNALRAVAVINRSANEDKHKEIEELSRRLVIPLSINYDGKIVPIWFYSVYKASLGIDDKLKRMKYLNEMAYVAKDSVKTKIFNDYFIGKMIKRMLLKERTLFNDIYNEYKVAKDQEVLTDALCSILSKNGMLHDLAYALWVFQPLLGDKVHGYSDEAIEKLALSSDSDKNEIEPLFKELKQLAN